MDGGIFTGCHPTISVTALKETQITDPSPVTLPYQPQLLECCRTTKLYQVGHKPGILSDFSEHGKLRVFCATAGKNCNKRSSFNLSFRYLCKTAVDWVSRI